MTFGTAQAGKASLQPATGKELFDRARDNRPQRPGTRFEAFLVSPDIALEMVLKKPVEGGSLGVPGTISRGRIRNAQVMKQRARIGTFSSPRCGRVGRKTSGACHGKP